MRVLLVTPSMDVGGNERVVTEVVRGLATRHHDAALFGPTGAFEVDVAAVPLKRVVVADRGRSPAAAAEAVGRLAALIRRWRPEVLHAFNPRMTLIADLARRIAVVPRPPLVATFGNCAQPELRRATRLLGRADLVCPASAELGAELEGCGLHPTRCRIVAPGIRLPRPLPPDARTALRRELSLTGGPIVLAVGRLVAQKDHLRLIEAARTVVATHPDVRVLVAGEGPLRGRLQARIDELGLARHVHLLGSRSDVPDLVAVADLVVFSSDWEGLSVAALEASAAGTPVVSTPACGMRELLSDGAGTVVAGFDGDLLAGAISGLLDDDVRRREVGRRAAARVAADYTVDVMVDGYLAAYRIASSSQRA